jgi:putative heme-binding domain-containing protein
MLAVHLEPHGASYVGAAEEFMTATPLPLTDVVINPVDGAMYFLIGGRKTQSGLYRVTYEGDQSTAPSSARQQRAEERAVRHRLEALHAGEQDDAIDLAWTYLKHNDRFVRFAARTAIEHQPKENWQHRALSETEPQASLTALLALVRTVPRSYKPQGSDLDTPVPDYPANEASRHPLQLPVLSALAKLEWSRLTGEQKRDLLRIYQLTFYRLGPPDEATRLQQITRLDSFYPAHDRQLDSMLTALLCYLQSPTAAAKGMQLLSAAPTQEEQIDVVFSLRFLDTGWTRDLHRELFEWFRGATAYKGGNNFEKFIQELKQDCLAHVPGGDRLALAGIINAPIPAQVTPLSARPRPFVKEWSMAEVIPLVETKLKHRNFARGRKMFAAANCFSCHHFAQEGGALGPDLTGLAGRFSARDILESVLEPDKMISDQYAAVVIQTTTGRIVTGRVTNFSGDKITLNTDMLAPNAFESVDRSEIEQMTNSTTSMMPAGLLNTLNEEELLDLMAFLLSRGNPQDPMFAEQTSASAASIDRQSTVESNESGN